MPGGADIIMEQTSIPSRMNISVLYEHYINGSSRRARDMVIEKIRQIDSSRPLTDVISTSTEKQTMEVFDIVLEYLSIFNTEQYAGYKEIKDSNNIYSIHEILNEIVNKELYVYYKVSSEIRPDELVTAMRNSKFAPILGKITIPDNGMFKETVDDNILVAPMYTMLLFKTGDEFLSCASAKVNHYNFPVGSSKHNKTRSPYRNSPTRVLGETEVRLYASYGSRKAVAELKDRANSIDTHKAVYKNILDAPQPTNISCVVDRNKIPFGSDSAITLIDSIFNSGGISIEYSPEDN